MCKIHREIQHFVQANKNLFERKCAFTISFKTWGTGVKRSSMWMVAPGGVNQVVEYQVNNTTLKELLWCITISTMKF